MHSIPGWKLARRPNYITNVDKKYPYSEVPFLGEYHLIKIPASLNDLIEHVDYWGEGKITTQAGVSGFPDCYNVNHTYQLVSNGPDRDRKIPNRIPVVSYTNCDTSGYIKGNSVKTVTVMGAPINSSCAKDIARMVNADLGRVVAYGFDNNSSEIKNLTTELKKKSIFHCPNYSLPNELDGRTLFDNNMVFLNLTTLKEELCKYVTNGTYNDALEMTKTLDNEDGTQAISDVVTQLLRTNTNNIMVYAYKLWNSGSKEIIYKNFPEPFKVIFNEEIVTIVNENYHQALRLDANLDSNQKRLAMGDISDKNSRKVSWNFIPMWDNGNVIFKVKNMDKNLFLKLDENVDSLGDRKVLGWAADDEMSQRYYLEPLMNDGSLMFRLINCQYNEALKMDSNADSYGNRLLWGYNGNARSENKSLHWIIAPNKKLWENEPIEI